MHLVALGYRSTVSNMSSRRRRGGIIRTDEQVLAHRADMALLRAVADGRVVRGQTGTDTGLMAPHLLDGEPVRMPLWRLTQEDLVEMPLSGAPHLAPRGRRLLSDEAPHTDRV